MQFRLFLFFLCILASTQARAERELKCRGALASTESGAGLYPNVFGVAFDGIYNGNYGESSKQLNALFSFLEIQGPQKTTEASMLLSSFFEQLYQSNSVVDRFYPSSSHSEAERSLKAQVLETLHVRIYVLSRVLEARPIREDLHLFARLLESTLGDFNPKRGFLDIPDPVLSEKLRVTREAYDQKLTEDAEPQTWRDSDIDFDAGENNKGAFQAPQGNTKIDAVVLPGEDKAFVERTLLAMTPESYKNAREKNEYSNFDEFAETVLYAYHLIHTRGGSGRVLINVYKRALEFLVLEVVVPKHGLNNQLKAARVKNYLIQLRKAMDGTLAPRFGESFAGLALESFHDELLNLRYHLNYCSNVRGLIKDAESLQELNTIFRLAEIDEFRIP